MTSKAIASLDAWLARAEEVLREQREQSLSPTHVPWDSRREESVVPVADFLRGLEALLGRLGARPGRWILIAEDNAQRQHFWQALAFEDGSLVTETVSNYYLEGEDFWGPEDEARLRALGWGEPDPPRRTNWIRVEFTTTPPVGEVAKLAADTLTEVFGLGDGDEVFVKLFGSPIRGDTPACPQYEAETDGADEGAIQSDEGDYADDTSLFSDDEGDELPDAYHVTGERVDARNCPTCGARGILPLAQPSDSDGTIEDPVMLCPCCEVEFRATGMTWLGSYQPGSGKSDGPRTSAEVT